MKRIKFFQIAVMMFLNIPSSTAQQTQLTTDDIFVYTNADGAIKQYKIVGENLIENPSFDNNTTGWVGGAGGALTGVDWHNSDGVDGGAYLHLTENAGKGDNRSIGTAWPLEKGKTYVFSYFIRQNSDANAIAKEGYIVTSETNTPRSDETKPIMYAYENADCAWTQNIVVTTAEYNYLQFCARWLGGSKCFDAFILAEVVDFTISIDGINYGINSSANSTMTVISASYSDNVNEYSGAMVIPPIVTYNGKTYRVTSIGNYAFKDCSNLTSITIPEGVTSIGSGAFSGCNSLTSITIPESVTSIGDNAFYGCSSLTSVTLPEGVASIGSGAFSGCNSLTSITIPKSVTNIGVNAFEGCGGELTVNCNIPSDSNYEHGVFHNSKFTKVIIGEGVTSIGNYAFYDCSNLTTITIPESVTSIGVGAFRGCSSLTSITLPESVTSIGYYAFEYCSSLTSITIPEGVTSINSSVFSGCSSLTSITIPEGSQLTSIESRAFSGCSSLTSITIPEGVKSIKNSAFQNCSSLTAITLPKSMTSIGYSAFVGCSSLTSITIPEGVTSIGDEAFEGCSSLTSITIPESVTSIGNYAFDDCSSLTSITIPEGVTSISSSVFSGCSSLTAITIPESVTSIGNYAFDDCSSLTSITIPEGVTSIGYNAFEYCSSLTSITIPEGVTSINSSVFSGCSSLTSITIPEGSQLTSIGNYAFYGCSSLASITIPEGVTSIGGYAFEYCANLTDINIGNIESWLNIEYANEYSHPGHSGINVNLYIDGDLLTELEIPSTVTYISDYAFRGCRSLTSITIPEGVTSIGNYAFEYCSSLTSITIPEGVTSIGNYAFIYCSSLHTVTNHSELPIIRGSSSYGYVAYYAKKVLNTKQLTTVGDFQFRTSDGIHYLANYTGDESSPVLPDSYNNENYQIDASAFFGSSNLTAITIPAGVTSIGNYAFEGCSNLREVVFENSDKSLQLGRAESRKGLFSDCPLKVVYWGRNLSYDYSPFYDCHDIHSLTIGGSVQVVNSSMFSDAPDKVVWLTNVPPANYRYANGKINYVPNNQYTSLDNVQIYPYLSSMFEVDGVTYVPARPSERTCHIIDCAYDSRVDTINIGETVSFKGVALRVTEVMPYAFTGNRHIRVATVTHQGNIGESAFADCDSLQAVMLSHQGIVGKGAFADCTALSAVTLADGVTGIMDEAFVSCSTLENISIPQSVTHIGSMVFNGCAALDTIVVAYGNTTYDSRKECNAIIETSTNILVQGCNATVIPESVIAIGDYAFIGCHTLESVILGERMKVLGREAFRDCTSLQEIVIPDSVHTVGEYCFYGCSALKDVTVGNGVTTIGDHTFTGCSSLESVILGEGMKVLGREAFRDCTSLQEFVIPDSVHTVGEYCFYGCSALKDVEIGGGVITIQDYAFNNCSSLCRVIIPQGTIGIGDYAFGNCTALSDIVIENRTQPLALGSNSSLPLFADCPLDSVYIGGKITYNTSANKGYSPFYRNASLRTVVITDEVTEVYQNEFCGCTALENVTIGNGVTTIGDYAFSGCSSLEGFSFGSSIESIGVEAFSDCTNLTNITSHTIIPPSCGAQALDDINKWDCVLRVPIDYATPYQAAEQWKEFFFIYDVVEVERYVITYAVDGEVYYTDSLAHKEEPVLPAEPQKMGYTFCGWSEIPDMMPAKDVAVNAMFHINSYAVNYVVDGEVYRTDPVVYCDTITVAEEPTKEGYTFSGWSEAPEAMPANDVTISGTFIVNKYLVTFKIGDEVIATDSLEYGAAIVAPEAPEREGHTFNGWSEVVETVPANDVTIEGSYSVNSYLLNYVVDGETVQSDSVAYGTAITLLDEPTKEGYTFSGWSEAPETMPAEDVTISGTFTVNKYLVTFKIGEEVIAADSLEYGAAIIAPEAPEKEGHTFNGWGEVAETVPANDLTYEGSYSVNSYLLTYTVDGETIQADSVAYGTVITLLDEPAKEGHTFSGWSEAPETMPAEDVTISGTFTVNIYKVYYYVGEELVHTAEVAYGEAIPEYTYEPTGEGDVFEGWIGDTYETMPAHDVSYTANITNGIAHSTLSPQRSTIYDLTGRKVMDTENLRGGIYIVNGKKIVIK